MPAISIIIPTKNRLRQILQLLDSIQKLINLQRIRPEIVVGDNHSSDQTWEILQRKVAEFPVPLRLFRIAEPGKCRILNEAISLAQGNLLVFLDDDVIVDSAWLEAIANYFGQTSDLVAQGTIRVPPEELGDPEVARLMHRFRTVHQFDVDPSFDNLGTLNGANMAIRREVFAKVGRFDIRLGPGASGTSEDVELAQRIRLAGIKIGYMSKALVYHELDHERLTESYFKTLHQKQGRSRLIYKGQSTGRIFFNLCRASGQFAFYSLIRHDRNTYRNKGRMYHYGAMLEAKLAMKRTATAPL